MQHTDKPDSIKTKGKHFHTAGEHAHGDRCGHKAVNHDDHIDYEHNGHLCRMHKGEVVECTSSKTTTESSSASNVKSVIYL